MRRMMGWMFGFALIGCGGKEGGAGGWTVDDIDPGTVAGTIGGVAWEMVTADVQPDLFEEGRLSVTLYADAIEPCGFGSSDLPFVLFSIDPTVGEHPLTLFGEPSQTVTLVVPPAQNNIATEGLIEIRSVSDTEVEMGLVAFMDDDNSVNGSFTADRCPDDGT